MNVFQLLGKIFDKKKLSIINFFISFPNREVTLNELSKTTRVSLASTHRFLNKLEKEGFLEVKKIKHLKLYKLANNDLTELLINIFETRRNALEFFVEEAKKIRGIRTVILHGEKKKDKANLLIIGDNVDQASLQSLVSKIFEDYNFKITYLTLSLEQYQQMSSMGLYSGKKEVLYDVIQ